MTVLWFYSCAQRGHSRTFLGKEKKKKIEKVLAEAGISVKEEETWRKWFPIAQEGHE